MSKTTKTPKVEPNTLHIVITDGCGDLVIGVRQTIDGSNDLKMILREPYYLTRLLEDCKTVKRLQAEIVSRPHPRYEWNGK